jgi:uncharacterized protein (TIGR02246 family)
MSDRQILRLYQLILGILAVVFVLAEEPSLAGYPVVPSPTIVNSTGQKRAESMQLEEIRAIITHSRDAWLKGDADAIASFFSPKGEFIVPGERLVGREAIRQVAASFFSTHSVIKIDIKRIIVEGNQAVVEWYWEDREKATGNFNKADDAIVVDFQDGQIRRWREYIDTKTWEDQSNKLFCQLPLRV